jgi:hypothetical protein
MERTLVKSSSQKKTKEIKLVNSLTNNASSVIQVNFNQGIMIADWQLENLDAQHCFIFSFLYGCER